MAGQSVESESNGDGPTIVERFKDGVAWIITERPWTVVLIFLALTVVMAGGMGAGGQEAGADQFTEELAEFEAYEAMQDDFQRGSRATGGTSAQLFISDDRNVLGEASLLRMLDAQHRLETDDRLRIASTTSPGTLVAREIDPTAETPEEQYRVIDRASQRQLDTAIAETADSLMVDTSFNPAAGTASVSQIAITYETPPLAGTSDYAHLQYDTLTVVDRIDGYDVGENVIILANAVIQDEVSELLGDTAIIVFPAAIILILFFLLIAYRDPIDLGLGLTALVMTLVWTFGFMGYAGIPFSDAMITVFPLLLAVGIDFGIHIINRYREVRLLDAPITEAMEISTRQLLIAFLIVAITTVFSFTSNLVSTLGSLREFGIVAAMGMIFTFLIFGVFLPAGKVGMDRFRERHGLPQFGEKPLGREGSLLGRILEVGTVLAKIAPVLVVVMAVLIGLGMGAYGTGVDVEFSQEVFFPDEDRIELFQALPGPLAPGDYHFMAALEHLEEDFEIPFIQSVTLYIDDSGIRDDVALRDIDAAISNPPSEFTQSDRQADGNNILYVIQDEAVQNPEFGSVVARYDETGDGVPDREVDQVFDELMTTSSAGAAENYLTTDRSATRIELRPNVDADDEAITEAAWTIAEGMWLDAVPTGDYVINQAVIERITESAVHSLMVAFLLTTIFLILSYWWLEGRAVYGVLNVFPVLLTVALLAGSMRLFDIALSPINAPILSVSIGLGVDYTVHFMHRFVDEYEDGLPVYDSLVTTIRGTGGALTGSMLTTVTGLGVLYLALIPLIMEFGLLLALGVFYAYLSSILVLPSAIVVWHRHDERIKKTTAAVRRHVPPVPRWP